MSVEMLITIHDVLLIGIWGWFFFTIRKLGGLLGRAFGFIMWGVAAIATSHILELFIRMFNWELEFLHLIEHMIVVFGFLLLAFGFSYIPKIKEFLE